MLYLLNYTFSTGNSFKSVVLNRARKGQEKFPYKYVCSNDCKETTTVSGPDFVTQKFLNFL